VDQCKQARV